MNIFDIFSDLVEKHNETVKESGGEYTEADYLEVVNLLRCDVLRGLADKVGDWVALGEGAFTICYADSRRVYSFVNNWDEAKAKLLDYNHLPHIPSIEMLGHIGTYGTLYTMPRCVTVGLAGMTQEQVYTHDRLGDMFDSYYALEDYKEMINEIKSDFPEFKSIIDTLAYISEQEGSNYHSFDFHDGNYGYSQTGEIILFDVIRFDE